MKTTTKFHVLELKFAAKNVLLLLLLLLSIPLMFKFNTFVLQGSGFYLFYFYSYSLYAFSSLLSTSFLNPNHSHNETFCCKSARLCFMHVFVMPSLLFCCYMQLSFNCFLNHIFQWDLFITRFIPFLVGISETMMYKKVINMVMK